MPLSPQRREVFISFGSLYSGADATLEKLLLFVSSAEEFTDIHIRKGEKGVLNELNKSARFRQKGKVQSVQVCRCSLCLAVALRLL
jgi:hypothetical protein